MTDLAIDPKSTALLVVDLQNFTMKMPTAPYTAQEVLAANVRLADACRTKGVKVVLIRVGHGGDAAPPAVTNQRVDQGFSGFDYPNDAFEIAPALGPKPGDLIVDKYNWGAFYGTNLDIHLRRRGIKTLIVTGLVTNIGVDTTMRHAQERGYAQILAHDACAAFSLEEHDYTLKKVAPRLALVRSTDQILAALAVA